jgi:hypothetical protein
MLSLHMSPLVELFRFWPYGYVLRISQLCGLYVVLNVAVCSRAGICSCVLHFVLQEAVYCGECGYVIAR